MPVDEPPRPRPRRSLLSRAQRRISRVARAVRSGWEPSRWSIAAIDAEPR